jgi:spore germination protein YaaH
MKEYDLAGVAAWRLGFESSDTWGLILKYVN